MSNNIYVIASVKVPGLHFWPDCTLPEVAYLKSPHRHVFHIKVVKEVIHADRQVEIIMLQDAVYHYIDQTYQKIDGVYMFGSKSCEMLAAQLLRAFDLKSCEVLEDGENGAMVDYIDDDLTHI